MNYLKKYKFWENLIVSQDLNRVLYDLRERDRVAALLMELLGSDLYKTEEDVNYLDLAKELNKFSFIPLNRRRDQIYDIYDQESMPTKIGRIVNKIYSKIKPALRYTGSGEIKALYLSYSSEYLEWGKFWIHIPTPTSRIPFIFTDKHSNKAIDDSDTTPPLGKAKITVRGYWNDLNEFTEITHGPFTGELYYQDVSAYRFGGHGGNTVDNLLTSRFLVKSKEFMEWLKNLNDDKVVLFPSSFVFDWEFESNLFITDSLVENFVTNVVAYVKERISGDESKLEIVKGEMIRKWYLVHNYKVKQGELGNSCMAHPVCQGYFDIYCKNESVVSMVILKDKTDDGEEKLLARALLWKLMNGEYLLDRCYAIMQTDAKLMQNWAEKQGYYYIKKENIYKGQTKLSVSEESTLKVKLDEWEFNNYPYVDNFHYLDMEKGILKIHEQGMRSMTRTLVSTGGKWEEWEEEYNDDDYDDDDWYDED